MLAKLKNQKQLKIKTLHCYVGTKNLVHHTSKNCFAKTRN